MYVPPSPVDEREPLLNVGSVAASQLPGESGNQRESAPRMAARPPHASPDGASPYQPAPAPHQPTSAPRTPPPPPVPFTPDPTAYWQEPGTPKLLSQVCLGSSVFLIVLGFGSFALLLPLFVGILGVFMSFTLLFNASEIISERIRKASAMSIVGIIVCVVGALQILFDSLLAGYECETDPQDATPSDCIITFIYIVVIFINLLVQGVVFKLLHYHLRISAALLNPATSGVVQI